MLRIMKEQLEAFDRVARANFHRRLAAYLREEMPEETARHADDALLEYIMASECRAAAHGIETESGIAQWTSLALVLGLDFDSDPTVCEYFKAPGMEPEEKLEIFVDGLNEALLDASEAQS
jgi:hypothetical protein